MKKLTLCLIAIFLNFINGLAQDRIPTIKDIPAEGVRLSGEWRFQNGDNKNYSLLDFNDSNWKTIDPSQDVKQVTEAWETDICWLRLHFIADSSLQNRSLALKISQSIASEIYLNGELIGTYGAIKNGNNKVIAISPVTASFIGFPLKQSGENVLSVRFSVQKDFYYTRFAGRPNLLFNAILIEVQNIEKAISGRNILYYQFLRVGIFLILTILHLGLFFYDKSQKSNLYFSIFSIQLFITNLVDGIAHWYIPELETRLFHLSYAFAFINFSYFVLLYAIYKVYNQKRKVLFWTIFLFAILIIIMPFIKYDYKNDAPIMLIIIVSLDIVRTSWLAYKAKHSGALIILISGLVLLLSFFAFYLCIYGYLNPGHNWIYGNFYVNLGVISLPIGISLYLALDASRKSKFLKIKINEVEKLSIEKEELLTSQKEVLEKQVTERTSQLSQSLIDLKATQAQLIQSEKMASLGELTAGIAHEIQNPLNFVNNYSEVNVELIEEIKEELEKGNLPEIKAIVADLEENEAKIRHHGQRADSIVRSMMQHSRTNSGTKEPTNLNALADEYLRLAYHGLRAKDSTFQADFSTDFDETLPMIEVVQQDMGRALLNIINNAFQAVHKKGKSGVQDYQPTVKVSTKNLPLLAGEGEGGRRYGEVEITISDNGNGIPEAIKDKIFQPFFTTKPTGQGTGLGLSLAYDIVKAHGGDLSVQTIEGENLPVEKSRTTFIIHLKTNW